MVFLCYWELAPPNMRSCFSEMSSPSIKTLYLLNAQSEDVIDSIYLESDLYFMPSLFEPCGISQMLAMRNGNPCLVHHTGGLKDTVVHMETGFAFTGDTYDEKIESMLDGLRQAIDIFQNNKARWQEIQANAKKARFTWERSVDDYYKLLYTV